MSDPDGDYPPLPVEATVESLWKSLNDLHEYAMEAIAAAHAFSAAATEAHINCVCAPAPHPQGEALRWLSAVEGLCTACGGQGWTAESDHGCDGTEELCLANCPVQVQVQCGGPAHEVASRLRALLAAAPAPTEAGDE